MLQTFDRIGPFIVVLSQSEAIPARKRRVVVRCVVCERVSEMNERSLLDKRTEEQRACAKCRVYTTNGTWTKGWRSKMENAAIEANRLNKENTDLRDEIDKVLRERDEARREADRFRHGCTVEGDFVCPNEHAVSELTAERNFLRALKKNHEEDFTRVCKERDEWRDKFHALNQTAGELCNACGWAFKIPGEPCRCEVIRERDEARAEVDGMRSQIERLRGVLHIVSLDEYESTSSAAEKVHAHARQARVVLNETLAEVTPSDAAHVASLENLFLKACKRAEKWETASKDAYRRGAEAMREACAAALMADGLVLSRERAANVVRALPIPEET